MSAGLFTLVVRQPVYDAAMAVAAYELHYEESITEYDVVQADARQATLRVIANAALEVGLERLAGGLPIHIHYPGELLTGEPLLPLHPKRVVVEVAGDLPCDAKVAQGITALRSRGHSIAVKSYSRRTSDPALLDLADMVKVDASRTTPDELARVATEIKGRGLRLLADEVGTLEQFERCSELGFERFQGNFLHHPQTFRAQRVPTSRLGSLRLVAALQNEDYSLDEVERLVSQDVAISYRVLRCINSSFYNLPRKVESIRQAIVILGLYNLRQLCTLVALQGFDDRPPSLFVNAMTRARMCEQLGRLAGAKDAGPFFMTGLLSMLNVLVGMPTTEIVRELPLAPSIAKALLDEEGELGAALRCARAYEHAAWKRIDYGDVAPQLIRAAYVDAVFWAEQARTMFAE